MYFKIVQSSDKSVLGYTCRIERKYLGPRFGRPRRRTYFEVTANITGKDKADWVVELRYSKKDNLLEYGYVGGYFWKGRILTKKELAIEVL